MASVIILLAARSEWDARDRAELRGRTRARRGRRIRGAVIGNRALLWNTGTLVATSGLGAGLGFAFWVVAARSFSQETVGYAAAAVSAMSLLATISLLGLGLLLVREIPRRDRSAGLVVASALVAAAAGAAAALLFIGVAGATGGTATAYVRGPAEATWFAAGVVLTTLGFLVDQAVIGRLWGGIQLWRNSILHVGKLGALLVAAPILDHRYGVGILAAWVLATAVSILVAVAILAARGARVFQRPDWVLLRGMRGAVGSHFLLELSSEAPRFTVPLLVTALISAETNAAFFAAWILLSLAHIIPYHLCGVLVAVGSGNPRQFAEKVRFALWASLSAGLVVVPVVILAAHPILDVFGASYSAEAAFPLQIMALSFFPVALQAHFVTIGRVEGRVWQTALALIGFFALEMVAITGGLLLDGLRGLAVAVVVSKVIEALLIAPVVLRVARRRAGPGTPVGTRTVHIRSASAFVPAVAAAPGLPHGGPKAVSPAPLPEGDLPVRIGLSRAARIVRETKTGD